MSKARSTAILDPEATSTHAGDATREKILSSATKAFSERGFDGATFRDIGADAGINFQSIRYHFGNKENLWEAVVARLGDQAETEIIGREQAIAAAPPRDQLKTMVETIVTYQAEHPELQRILLREAMKGSARYRKAFHQHVKKVERAGTAALSRFQKQGVIKPGIVIEDLFYAFRGAINYRIVAPPVGDTRGKSRILKSDIIKRHAEVIYRMLVADE